MDDARRMLLLLVLLSGCRRGCGPAAPAVVDASADASTHDAVALDASVDAADADAPRKATLTGPPGFCAIASGFDYYHFAQASELVTRLRAAGLEADVYNTRDFDDLAWGQLVAIAGYDDERKSVDDIVARLHKEKLATHAYTSACAPSSAPALRDPADVHATILAGSDPIDRDFTKEQAPGCFAWSPKKRAAACFVGEEHPSHGSWSVTFVGTNDPSIPIVSWTEPPEKEIRVEGATRVLLQRALEDGGYVDIHGQSRFLEIGRRVPFILPPVTFTWTQDTVNHVDAVCADGTTTELVTEPIATENLATIFVAIQLTPDPSRLLLEYEVSADPDRVVRNVIYDAKVTCEKP